MNRTLSSLCAPIVVALIAVLLSPSAHAAPRDDAAQFDVREFVCPLGGAKFSADVGYPSLALVQFVDGSWLGDTQIDVQIPQCPGNALLLIPDYEREGPKGGLAYLDYTPAQVARLPMLLASAEFSALRGRSRHERAHWLATQLGLPAWTRLQLLMRGSWSATDASERRRLVSRIADEGPKLVDEIPLPEAERLVARLRVANASRELGRFDEANARLDAILAAVPADADLKNPEAEQALQSIVAGLREAIAHGDDDRFPVDLSSQKWADRVCNSDDMQPPYGPKSKHAQAACDRRDRDRQASSNAYEEAARLREQPEELDRQCARVPAAQRSAGLAQACEFAQNARDEKAAEQLLSRQARQVAADCEATPAQERTGALRFACYSYQSALEFALAGLLVEDDAGYTVVCHDGKLPPDRAAYADLACSMAERQRLERSIERLLADPVSLDRACASNDKDRKIHVSLACSRRHSDLAKLQAQRLAADPAAYKKACAAFDAQASDVLRYDMSDEEALCGDARRIREREAESQRAVAAAPERASEDDTPAASPAESLFESDSELSKVALEYAQRVVAKAKAEGSYPKRKRGDLY